MLPTDERLDAHDLILTGAARRDPNLWLVEELELVALDRPPEVVLQGEAGVCGGVHRGVEDLVAGLAFLFCPVHRQVGAAYEVLQPWRVVRGAAPESDAHARDDVDLATTQRERLR